MTIDTAKERERLAKLDGHTPGPWQTDEGGEVHAYGRPVAAWPKGADESDPDRILADLRLCAASPDLKRDYLAALDAIDAQAAEIVRLQDFAENVVIASGMGWDMGGVVKELVKFLEGVAPEREP